MKVTFVKASLEVLELYESLLYENDLFMKVH